MGGRGTGRTGHPRTIPVIRPVVSLPTQDVPWSIWGRVKASTCTPKISYTNPNVYFVSLIQESSSLPRLFDTESEGSHKDGISVPLHRSTPPRIPERPTLSRGTPVEVSRNQDISLTDCGRHPQRTSFSSIEDFP